jgi:hypothetical protein
MDSIMISPVPEQGSHAGWEETEFTSCQGLAG